MNPEKLKALQSSVRVGGKGTVRRKKKIVHKASSTDDKKLQSQLKKLSINPIPGIEEVNMFKDDGSVLHFQNPKVRKTQQPVLIEQAADRSFIPLESRQVFLNRLFWGRISDREVEQN
jgi:hypothetical protein